MHTPASHQPQFSPQPSSPQTLPSQVPTQQIPSSLQVTPASHSPQVPPQPSLPQAFPTQSGRQHWPSEHTCPCGQLPQLPPQPSSPHSFPMHPPAQSNTHSSGNCPLGSAVPPVPQAYAPNTPFPRFQIPFHPQEPWSAHALTIGLPALHRTRELSRQQPLSGIIEQSLRQIPSRHPLSQVPQVPPQPSLPQALSSQSGTQSAYAGYDASTIAIPNRTAILNGCDVPKQGV